MWLAAGFVCAVLVALFLKYVFSSSGLSPFDVDTREPLKPMVLDKKEKDKVLKQGFESRKVPQCLDAVVIGSGAGGLGLAVLLAKVGKKVLVLEQHSRAGGCCHTFSEKGFEFDVGIHYVGDLQESRPFRCLLDQLTNGQLQWEPLDNPFDRVVLGPPENRRTYPIYSGREHFAQELKKCFPGEDEAIDEFLRLTKKCDRGVWMMAVLKLLPFPLAKFLACTGLADCLSHFFRYGSRSLAEVVNGLTQNKDLRAVLCYVFGTYGVSVLKGQEEVHVQAPLVISDAGIFNTYNQLLPREVQKFPAIQKQLGMLRHGAGGLSVFLGLAGSKEELGLKAENHWIFSENNLDELMDDYLKGERDECVTRVPMVFAASPSAKDPTWEQRKPGKSTLSLVTFAPYEWFEEWKDGKVKNRGPDYTDVKKKIIQSLLEVVTHIFPKITDKIEYVDAGTAVTNQHYIAAPRGEFYGADHNTARFTADVCASIRPQTPVRNLFLTGQDLCSCGLAGALVGAMICGSAILNRNLYMDVTALNKKLKHANAKKAQ
ncbi:all-trans-retinol 13,14-reductase isoform X2 [Electrophorus electricus]|uniref:all-trans-retinol 13,14-reductase isoform X2 n=1 Tax=Electrophorus electricus TaxID=8005 RepID=UPI0015D04F3F|nr:all-trans-retinol 13,14-reductase isoform X2 [Electrophorus electricus]